MPEVMIQPGLWKNLRTAAAKKGETPEALAIRAIRQFLDLQTDEDLIARSRKAARKSTLAASETERAIRRYRSVG